MWILPFIHYRHAVPLTTFDQDWLAGILGLLGMILLLNARFWLQPQVPRIILLPVGLAVLVLIQYAMGRMPYFGQALLVTEYLLWAALLMLLGQQLRQHLGLPKLVTILAVCLLVGAEISALIGLLQHFSWRTFLDPVISLKSASGVIYGNMGQPNHFANYVSLGLISLLLLGVQGRVRAWHTILLAVPLLFVLVLSGSRSAWIYMLALPVLAWIWQRRDAACRIVLRYSLVLLAGFALMHLLVNLPILDGATGSVTGVDRLTGLGATSVEIRLQLWREAVLIFLQYPWLGAGAGQFSWQHYLLGPEMSNALLQGLYNNAHNLVLHTAAEWGLVGLVILLATLFLWLRQLMQAELTLHHWWGAALLLVLGVHSLLEYPLWYAYFLGIGAVVLGMMDNTALRLAPFRLGRWVLCGLLAVGLLSMMQLYKDYQTLQKAVSATVNTPEVRDDLRQVARQPLLHAYAEMYLANLITVQEGDLESQLSLADDVMRFIPIGSVAYRQALLLALLDKPDIARQRVAQAVWSWPHLFQLMRPELEVWAMKDPVRCAPLLEFAIQKYEERQRAAIFAR